MNATKDAVIDNNADAPKVSEANGPKRDPKRPRPTKELPTDRIKPSKQIDILRVYGTLGAEGKPVTNKEVGTAVELSESTVGMCNAFWTANDFLAKVDGGFTPASEVVQLARAYEWNQDAAPMKLAALIERSWFMRRLNKKLPFRAISEEEALADLAEEAQAATYYKSQLQVLIDYVVLAGICARENGMLKLVKVMPSADEPIDKNPEPSTSIVTNPQPMMQVTPKAHQPEAGGIHVQFSVHVSQAELESWQPDRIAALFEGVAKVLSAKGKSGQEVQQK